MLNKKFKIDEVDGNSQTQFSEISLIYTLQWILYM